MRTRVGRFLTIVWVALLLVGCSTASSEPLPTVHLHDLSPVPTPDGHVEPLHVAVAAIISPRGTLESYQPLMDYLQQELGRPVELVQRRTYAEVNDLVRRNEVDVAFVCTRAYVEGKRQFGMQLLAVPVVHGQKVYYSQIIVKADSPYHSFADLRGAVFAFTDPLSNSGYLYPNVLLARMHETPQTFFSRTFFTYSHDNAIHAVADGVADAAAVDSLVLQYALEREPDLRNKIRVIHTSEPFGMPPVVTGPDIRPQTKAQLQSVLFSMHQDPRGRLALNVLDVDRFVRASDADYDMIREMIRLVESQSSK